MGMEGWVDATHQPPAHQPSKSERWMWWAKKREAGMIEWIEPKQPGHGPVGWKEAEEPAAEGKKKHKKNETHHPPLGASQQL
jgi:hypothetical protein